MAEEIITSTNAETATDHEYNASRSRCFGMNPTKNRITISIKSTPCRQCSFLAYLKIT